MDFSCLKVPPVGGTWCEGRRSPREGRFSKRPLGGDRRTRRQRERPPPARVPDRRVRVWEPRYSLQPCSLLTSTPSQLLPPFLLFSLQMFPKRLIMCLRHAKALRRRNVWEILWKNPILYIGLLLCSRSSQVRHCHGMDCSAPGSSVHGILQARTLEWLAIPFARNLFNSGIKPRSPALQADS